MSSTNVVNFSLRQNKSIERGIVFDCLGDITRLLQLSHLVYVGLGSVWFSDFVLAHRLLGIDTMISIESDEVIYKRAAFNKLYRTLEVIKGSSADVIPRLVERDDLVGRPWIAWLDFDDDIDRDKLDELVELIRILPSDSILLTTFSAYAAKYGRNENRPEYLKLLFRDAAPEGISSLDTRKQEELTGILAESTERYLTSSAIQSGRPGSFIPTIRLMYRDSAPMATVGGVLPRPENEESVRQLVNDVHWPGRSAKLIQVPHLTAREVLALQSGLPSGLPITRDDVRQLGFDLQEDQLDSYVEHYIRYPQFSQVAQ
jgi:hypothetical protein